MEHISLPALYRLVCREMGQVRGTTTMLLSIAMSPSHHQHGNLTHIPPPQGCKVKVLKMSAQATCKQFIANLDQS